MTISPKSLNERERGVLRALCRAARRARRLAEETGTPFYVYQDGKIVNQTPRDACVVGTTATT